MGKKCYIAIDLKSFYASVECIMRGLDPLTTNLVVADASRTAKGSPESQNERFFLEYFRSGTTS